MTYETILTTQDGPSRILTLNRLDKRNAVSTLMMREIAAELNAATADAATRAVIITGGPSIFSAGADLNEALQVKTAEQGTAYFGQWHMLNSAIYSGSKRRRARP